MAVSAPGVSSASEPSKVLSSVATAAVLAAVLGWGIYRLILALRSDEERVRRTIREIVDYAKEKDAGAVLENVAPEYHDAAGYTRRELELGLRHLFNASRRIDVEAEVLAITVQGDEAVARLRAKAELETTWGILRLRDAGLGEDTFELKLRREGHRFLVKSVREAPEASTD